MSRPESKITAAEEAGVDVAELLAAFEAAGSQADRRDAIARYLAAAPGWREAREALGGAFAASTEEAGLKGRKAP